MRFVTIIVAVAMFGAGAGLVSVGTAQAHGGGGGVEALQSHPMCAVANSTQAGGNSCTDLLDVGDRQ
jgi:hypothetical protein